jgi:hypothetical protein
MSFEPSMAEFICVERLMLQPWQTPSTTSATANP